MQADCTTNQETLERNRVGQKAWRALQRDTHTDAEETVTRFMTEFPDVIPECFRHDGSTEQRWRRRRGLELVYGKSERGVRSGGIVGRLRVLAGEPLEHRYVQFRDVDALCSYWQAQGRDVEMLKSLRFCPMTQFSTQTVEEIILVLRSILPEPSFFVIERSDSENHAHFLCKQGATALGTQVRIVPDENLVTCAGYLGKRPLFIPEHALWYTLVRRLQGGRAATRHGGFGGCENRNRISLSDVERVLGPCPQNVRHLDEAARIELLTKSHEAARRDNGDSFYTLNLHVGKKAA